MFDKFVKQYKAEKEQSVPAFLKENGMGLWELLGDDGYSGDEFTDFEAGVLLQLTRFLEKHDRVADKLLEIVEDYLVEEQPKARKEVAIAAGAIRFGQEHALFESLQLTVKEIAEAFEISTSSLNKYYNDLNAYYANKELVEA